MVYAILAEGRDEQQLAQLDATLAPTPEAAQESIDRANMKAMQALQASMGAAMPKMPQLPKQRPR